MGVRERSRSHHLLPRRFDYVLNRPTELHVTAGSRDALGIKADEEHKKEEVSNSTKAQMGLQDQLTDDV
jgi:hypothetical protein